MHRTGKVGEELRKLLVIAAFFSTGFLLITISERFFTRGSSVEIGSYVKALVGGLIVAKVLLLVDLVPFIHAFPDKPLIHNITWKSSIYVAASVAFLYLEPLVKQLFRGMGLAAAHAGAFHELMMPRTWAVLIWLAMLLVAFVTMQELSRVLGNAEFRRMFFGHRFVHDEKPDVQKRVRAA